MIDLIVLVIAVSAGGALLGTVTGLVPGIHVNTLAALMLSFYPVIDSFFSSFASNTGILVAACIMSAAVVHSFVDFVPSVFLGVPDPDEVMNVLPGHRMLLEGRGIVAVRYAAAGSLVGCLTAVVVAVPLQFMLSHAGDYLEGITSIVLIIVVLMLVIKERGKDMIWAAFLIMMSGLIGIVCMHVLPEPSGIIPAGSFHLPLLTGLFGLPAMLLSVRNPVIPEQTDDAAPINAMPGLKGAVVGGIVGWFPGITATSGAVIASSVTPENGGERFISLTSSIGTASAVFALVTLSVNGGGRTGAVMAIRDVLGNAVTGIANPVFILLLLSVAVSALIGYIITIRAGIAFARFAGRTDFKKLNVAVIVTMVALVWAMTGFVGFVVLMVSVIIGLIPTSANVSRVHLSGCLLIPALMSSFGIV